jgi:hypothetical protein
VDIIHSIRVDRPNGRFDIAEIEVITHDGNNLATKGEVTTRRGDGDWTRQMVIDGKYELQEDSYIGDYNLQGAEYITIVFRIPTIISNIKHIQLYNRPGKDYLINSSVTLRTDGDIVIRKWDITKDGKSYRIFVSNANGIKSTKEPIVYT